MLFPFFLKKNISNKNFNFIIIASSFWLVFLIYKTTPAGFNLSIYTYNANLTLYGKPAFGRDLTEGENKDTETYRLPEYLDYSGLQHLIYVVLTFINFNYSYPQYFHYLVGFEIWSTLWIFIIIFLLKHGNYFNESSNSINQKFWFLILISFHPAFYLNWILQWEDKITLLALPLIILILMEKKYYFSASFLLGISIALNGILIFFVPPFMIYMLNINKRRFWLCALLFFVGVIIAMIPYFPESLYGWQNRVVRTNTSNPFWFSIYILLPNKLYTPLLNKSLLIILPVLSTIAYWKKYINLYDALIISVMLVISLSPYNGIQRVLPLILLITILTTNVTRLYWMLLSIVLTIYVFLFYPDKQNDIKYIDVVLFYVPLFFVSAYYVYCRFNGQKQFTNNKVTFI